MANTLTDMSKIRKVLKLYGKGNSKLFISTYLSLSRNTVKKYISLFEASGKTKEEILSLLAFKTVVGNNSNKLATVNKY